MRPLSLKSLTLNPHLSEKGYGLSSKRVYVFEVEPSANSTSVKAAIEEQFSVKVAKINMLNIAGKAKRTISKQGRIVKHGRDNSIKKAYVTLVDGNSLPFYEAIEEEEKKAEKVQEKISKELEKQEKPKRRARKESKE